MDKFPQKLEIRSLEQKEDSLILSGYIAKFNQMTELWKGYYEKILPGAFDNTLKDNHNIFLIFDHDYSKILASTQNNTLTLAVDEVGLYFEAKINSKLSYAVDVYELVRSGEINGCSFGFKTIKDAEQYIEKGILRNLLEVEIYEVTITAIPAYEDTEVQARAKNRIKEHKAAEEKRQALLTELELIEIQNNL